MARTTWDQWILFIFSSPEKLSTSALAGTSLFTFNLASTQTTRGIFRRCDNVGRDASNRSLPVRGNINRCFAGPAFPFAFQQKEERRKKKKHATWNWSTWRHMRANCGTQPQSQSNTSKLFFVLKTEPNIAVPARKSAQIKGRGNDTPLREQVHRHDS